LATNSLPVDAIVLAGPTASGKTQLLDALFGEGKDYWIPRLSSAWGVAIRGVQVISADSMQAYRFMDIGTAKPDRAVRARLFHHLIDIKDPREQYTVGEFVAKADSICAELVQQSILPVVSGGTGFYLKNFLCGLPLSPQSEANIRAGVARDLELYGAQQLRDELSRRDPLLAARIHARDIYRLTRAVEILRTTGQAPSRFAPSRELRPGKRFIILGLALPREMLHARIHARVRAMSAAGLAEEVQHLVAMGYHAEDPGMRAIGYREFFENPTGPLEEIEAAIELHTRQYAKRQMTFSELCPVLRGYH